MKQVLAMLVVILLMSAPVLAQEIDYCEGDFDCDGDCDGTDASVFKLDFGRSNFQNSCPNCVPIVPVVKTGHNNCYDTDGNPRDCAGTGEDGEYQLGYERFIDNSDGTITDNFTRLMWLQDLNCIATNYPNFDYDSVTGDGEVTWQHALDFVSGVNDGTYPLCGAGYTDWRLPSVNEGQSIVGWDQYH